MTATLRVLCPLALVLLSACGGTPACSDSDTLDLLDEIIEEEFQESAYGKQIRSVTDYRVRGIRTLGHDKDVDIYQCAATLELRMNGRRPIEQEFEYDIYTVEDEDADFEIHYDDAIEKAIQQAGMARAMGWG